MTSQDKSKLTLRDVAGDYVLERTLTDRSAATFAYAIRKFDEWLGRPATLDDLTTAKLNAWVGMLTVQLAPSTAHYYRSRLCTIWNWAFKTGLVAAGPYVRVLRRPKRGESKSAISRSVAPPRQWPFRETTVAAISSTLSATDAVPTPTPEMRLADYYEAIYSRMKLAVRAMGTKRLYRNTLRLFDKWLGRPATLADLNDSTVTAHIGWIVETGRSPRTGNKSRDQLLAIWRYAARKRHVELFPDVEPLQEYKRLPVAWTIGQLAKLIDVARRSGPGGTKRLRQPSLCGVPANIWWTTLLLVLYDCGLRIGATLQLRCEDYDSANRRLFVRAEIQKQRADQVLPVSEETAGAIEICIAATRREQLFPWPHDMSLLYKHFARLLKAAGLPTGRTCKFHRIRKTSATMAELVIGPGGASVHLGHSSPRVTEKYLDRSMLPTANVAAALPRPVLAEGGAA